MIDEKKLCSWVRESYGLKNQRKGNFMSERTQSHTPGPNKLPARYLQFQKKYPKVFQAYDALGAATAEAGPLTDKTRALVKLAIAVGGQMEGAVHSHTRRALEAGCSAEEIYHVVLLGTTTLGFPTMMKTFSWVEDVLTQKG
jgi:alkylhydroperoxidase/carboxymuconolactone decarboxylase family protein YurZ